MADCNIRNIEPTLMRTAKSKAAEEGITLRDWVVRAIEAYSGFEVESREKPKRERKSVYRAENAGNFKNSPLR